MVHIGIDLGTTSVKLCLLEGSNVVWENNCIHNAGDRLPYGIHSAKTILEVSRQLLQECMAKCEKLRITTQSLNIAGQMHGIVFWNEESIEKGDIPSDILLYTWLYQNKLDIDSLPRPAQNTVHAGFGSVTFIERRAEYGSKYNRCGTIMDLLSCLLTGNSTVNMSEQLAVSWGYCSSMQWDKFLQESAGANISLPTIVKNGSCLGKWIDYPFIKVYAPIGDLQSSVASVRIRNDTSRAYLVMGTSAQLCVVSPRLLEDLPASLAKLPYSATEYLYAACSMNGGNAVDNLLNMIENFFPEGCRPTFDRSNIFDQLDKEEFTSFVNSSGTFIPERNVCDFNGVQLLNLMGNTSILEVVQSVCYGVVDNLFNLFPLKLLEYLGVQYIVLVGGAKKNRYRRRIKQILSKSSTIEAEDAPYEASAALGAVLFNN